MTTTRTLSIGLAVLAVLQACGGDAAQTATAVIESEIADQIGLGELDADCEEPEDREVGAVFPCTATTESGEVIQLTVEFEEEDRIFVLPTNVMPAADMGALEAEAAATLGPEVGAEIDPSAVDCPDTSVVLDADDQLRCEITDVDTGTTYALVVTLTEFVRGEGFQGRFYEIGDPIE